MRSSGSTTKTPSGSALIQAGELAEQRGDHVEAGAAFEAALEDPDPATVAAAHNCLGRLAWQQGAYDAAFPSFERARAIAIRLDAPEIRARAEIGLANVLYARGDYAQARELYESVVNNPASPGLRGKALLNLGTIANIEGDVATAERLYRRAHEGFAEVGDVLGQAQAYHNLGLLHAGRLEWDDADVAYREAIKLSAGGKNREMVGLITMARSELSCAMGSYDAAVAHCDTALEIFSELGAELHRGTTLRWKGRALRELGRYAPSERALAEAARIAHRAEAKRLEAESMRELGATLARAGNSGAARKWISRALELFIAVGATREAGEARADLETLADPSP